METLEMINRWLGTQHVLTYCAGDKETLWCANAFYYFDTRQMAFYLLSEEDTRHSQLIGQRAKVAGTVNGQPRTVALIRGIQFRGEIRRMDEQDAAEIRRLYCLRFPVAREMKAPVWEIWLDELKMTDNTLGFGKKLHWSRNRDRM